jgi:hypothetical protein
MNRLGRVPTEPVVDQASHTSHNSESSQRKKLLNELICTYPVTRFDHYPQSDSQRSEIDTPLITPASSFRQDTPDIRIRDARVDSIPQTTGVMDSPVLYSQLGSTHAISQLDDPHIILNSQLSTPSPLRRTHSTIIRGSPLKLSRRAPSSIGRTSSCRNLSSAPRYFLRQRKPISHQMDTTSGRTRGRGRARRGRSNRKQIAKPGKV